MRTMITTQVTTKLGSDTKSIISRKCHLKFTHTQNVQPNKKEPE